MRQVTIRTKDFVLRPRTLKDAQFYLDCHKDKEAKKNFMSVPKNLKEARKEISEGMKKKSLRFVIEYKEKPAGFITLELNDNPRYKHSAIIGYAIHSMFRGKGLATKATKVLSDYGFNKLKLIRITGWCRTFNKASAKVLKKAGFKFEGILRKNKCKDGKYLDDMIWAKVK
jgi:ribosomal-protein-alanine N-acetyltransferase